MNKAKYLVFIFLIFSSIALFADSKVSSKNTEETQAKEVKNDFLAFKYLSAAIAVGIACIAGGFAVGKIGAAAMGAMSEKPEVSGKAIPFVGLAEGICLWGFLVALLILLL